MTEVDLAELKEKAEDFIAYARSVKTQAPSYSLCRGCSLPIGAPHRNSRRAEGDCQDRRDV